MSNPRFSPRRYIEDWESFGRVTGPRWLDDVRSDHQRDQLAAAQLQHQFALRIYRAIRHQRKTLKAYAEMCDVPYDRLAKVMRGEVIMRLEDIAQAERILGGILTPGDMMSPPTHRIDEAPARTNRRDP
jgi:hypothetical protein